MQDCDCYVLLVGMFGIVIQSRQSCYGLCIQAKLDVCLDLVGNKPVMLMCLSDSVTSVIIKLKQWVWNLWNAIIFEISDFRYARLCCCMCIEFELKVQLTATIIQTVFTVDIVFKSTIVPDCFATLHYICVYYCKSIVIRFSIVIFTISNLIKMEYEEIRSSVRNTGNCT